MAEAAKEGDDEGFSFVDKVRYMMYGEKEKEAFLIEKKEKEEKKKAKMKAAEANSKPKHHSLFGQIKSYFVPETNKDSSNPTSPAEEPTPLQEASSSIEASQSATEQKY